jgi:plasmid maintenance system killer protein
MLINNSISIQYNIHVNKQWVLVYNKILMLINNIVLVSNKILVLIYNSISIQ